jgi:hypothetical protein
MLAAVTAALVFLALRYGRLEALEEDTEDIDAANKIRDRLRRDASFAQRVRERFTR